MDSVKSNLTPRASSLDTSGAPRSEDAMFAQVGTLTRAQAAFAFRVRALKGLCDVAMTLPTAFDSFLDGENISGLVLMTDVIGYGRCCVCILRIYIFIRMMRNVRSHDGLLNV
ncbi:unnamed protein product [Amoebophrya sp. A25]|nr:unnamed protein product [Amoebophrya sp. A25]|eukprot:GSA25T00026656001.1